MKFKISQDCDYAEGFLRYGHLEGIIEAESKEELEKMIRENPEEVEKYMEFELDSYELTDYERGNNPIVIEGEVGD